MRRRTFSSWMIGVAVASAIALTGCDDVLGEFQKELFGADKPDYGIALSKEEAYVFASEEAVLALRVKNTGIEPTGELTVEFIEDSKAFKLSKTELPSINAGKSSSTFTVKVVAGLAAGEYKATVLVSGDNDLEATLDVSFTVTDAEAAAAAKAAEEKAAAEAAAAAEAEAKAAEAKAAADAEAKAAAEAAEAKAAAEAAAAADAEAKAAEERAAAEAAAAAEADAEAKAAAEAAAAAAAAAAEAAEAAETGTEDKTETGEEAAPGEDAGRGEEGK